MIRDIIAMQSWILWVYYRKWVFSKLEFLTYYAYLLNIDCIILCPGEMCLSVSGQPVESLHIVWFLYFNEIDNDSLKAKLSLILSKQ